LKENDEMIKTLKEKVGDSVIAQLLQNKSPEFEIKIRSIDNAIYDDAKKILLLGDKTQKRRFNNLKELKSFAQMILIARAIYEANKEVGYTTQRDIYYNALETIAGTNINTLENQKESNAIITDLEVFTGLLREEMGVVAEERGVVSGKLKLKGLSCGEEQIVDCEKGLTGQLIPTNMHEIEIMDLDAKQVLVIEKGGIFKSLRELNITKKLDCILVSGHGQPDRASRRLVHRLNKEYNLPVCILTDSDPWGWRIFSTYKIGSRNLAYESEKLATPDAKFIGVYPSDIERYNFERGVLKANPRDIVTAQILMKLPWFADKKWQEELALFLKVKKKVEINIFSQKGFRFLADEYIPNRIKE
jgi:DNA topoisomerase-6 subunit A